MLVFLVGWIVSSGRILVIRGNFLSKTKTCLSICPRPFCIRPECFKVCFIQILHFYYAYFSIWIFFCYCELLQCLSVDNEQKCLKYQVSFGISNNSMALIQAKFRSATSDLPQQFVPQIRTLKSTQASQQVHSRDGTRSRELWLYIKLDCELRAQPL